MPFEEDQHPEMDFDGFILMIENVNKTNVEIGVAIELDCMQVLKVIIETSSKLAKIFTKVRYIVCSQNIQSKNMDNQRNLGTLFDTQLYIKRVFLNLLPHLVVKFRLALEMDLKDHLSFQSYLRLLTLIKEFATKYDITYFLVNTFRNKPEDNNAWWIIQNYNDLTDVTTYREMESGKFSIT